MARLPARARRARRLWSAAWLGVFLVAGLLVVGELPGEWLVLAVPLLWALPALRPVRDDVPAQPWERPPPAPWRAPQGEPYADGPLGAWEDEPPRARAADRLRPPRDWAEDPRDR